MSGCTALFPSRRQPHLHSCADPQHAHMQLRGQLVAVAGRIISTAEQSDRLLAQAGADNPGAPAMPAIQALGHLGKRSGHPMQPSLAPGHRTCIGGMRQGRRLSVEAQLLPFGGLQVAAAAVHAHAMLGDRDHAVVTLHGQIKRGAQRGDGTVRCVYLKRSRSVDADLEPGLAALQLQLATLCVDADMHFAARRQQYMRTIRQGFVTDLAGRGAQYLRSRR